MPNFDATNLGQGTTDSVASVSAADVTAAATDLRTLINTLCPDSVEWKPLVECSEMQRGTMLTQKDVVTGDVPVISGGVKPAYYHNTPNRTGETVTVASSGASSGYVQYWNQPIYVNDAFSVKGIPNLTDTKFLYYYLKNIQPAICATKIGGGVPHVRIDGIKNFRIPVPPLAVQEKIVQILNKFTELAKELAKEKQARRTQYEYYRDWLLDLAHPEGKQGKVWDLLRTLCPDGVEWKTLGEYCEILDTKRKPIAKSKRISGDYPYYGANGIQDYVNDYLLDGTYLLVAEDGSVLTPSGNPVVNWATGRIWVNNHAHILHKSDITQLRYLYYYMQTINISQLIHGNIPKLTGGDLRNIKVPIPPLPVQAEIVRILDQFSTLAEDITAGLPAEIAARQTQYEYYRNQLLSFNER